MSLASPDQSLRATCSQAAQQQARAKLQRQSVTQSASAEACSICLMYITWSVHRLEVVSLLEATQQLLEQKAAAAPLTSRPQPYDVLYDFYCMRSNFKSAAAAQYTLACRLADPQAQVPQRIHLRATALCESSCSCCILGCLSQHCRTVYSCSCSLLHLLPLRASPCWFEDQVAASKLSGFPGSSCGMHDPYVVKLEPQAVGWLCTCWLLFRCTCFRCTHCCCAPAVQALNALSMVEPSQQWILHPGPLQEALRPGTPFSDQPSLSSSDQQSSDSVLSKGRAGLTQSVVILSSSSRSAISHGAGCTDLTKEHAAAHAHALLARIDPDAARRAIPPDDIFHRLLALGEVTIHHQSAHCLFPVVATHA